MRIDSIASILRDIGEVEGMLSVHTDSERANKMMASARFRLSDIAYRIADELPDADTSEVEGAFKMLEIMGNRRVEEVSEDGGDTIQG